MLIGKVVLLKFKLPKVVFPLIACATTPLNSTIPMQVTPNDKLDAGVAMVPTVQLCLHLM